LKKKPAEQEEEEGDDDEEDPRGRTRSLKYLPNAV